MRQRTTASGKRFQFSLSTLLLMSVALCPMFAILAWWPPLGAGVLALAASLGISLAFAFHASIKTVRIIVLVIQTIALLVTLLLVVFSLIIATIGLIEGTDTCARTNAMLALGGLALASIGIVNGILVAIPYRSLHRVWFVAAILVSSLFLIGAIWTWGGKPDGNLSACLFYVVGLFSINTIVMKYAIRNLGDMVIS